MSKKTLFILEVETGLIDGWYFVDTAIPGDNIDGVKKFWDEARPGLTHILCEKLGDDSACISDDRALNGAAQYGECPEWRDAHA